MELCYKIFSTETAIFLDSLVSNTNILIHDDGLLESYNPCVLVWLPENTCKNICKRYEGYVSCCYFIDIAQALYRAYFVIFVKHGDTDELKEYYKQYFYDILQDVYEHKFFGSYVLKVTVFNICSNACQAFNDTSLLKYIINDEHVELDRREKKYLMKYVPEFDITEIVKKFDYYTKFMCENAKIWITLENSRFRRYWSVSLVDLENHRDIKYDESDNYRDEDDIIINSILKQIHFNA